MTVTMWNVEKDGSGSPIIGKKVSLELYTGTDEGPGYGNGFAVEAVGEVLTDSTGRWEAVLPSTDVDILNPVGSVYVATIRFRGGLVTHVFRAPQNAAAQKVTDHLTELPGALPGPPLQAHLLDAVDAHDASAVSFTPTRFLTEDNVQAAGAALVNLLPYYSRVTVNSLPAAAANAALLNAEYAALKAAGRGELELPDGVIYVSAPLVWDSNDVSINASENCVIQLIGAAAKITARPTALTSHRGPAIKGFQVIGDPLSPAGAVGIETGDTTGWQWDIYVLDFDGAGSIGIDIVNVDPLIGQTERNYFGFTVFNCATSMRLRTTTPARSSFGHNEWALFLNADDGQLAMDLGDNVMIYGGHTMQVTCNITGTGKFMKLGAGVQIAGPLLAWSVEQTFGTGGVGLHFTENTSLIFLRGKVEFLGGLTHIGPPGGPRRTPVFRPLSNEAVMGSFLDDYAWEGSINNWLGLGLTANVHPCTADNVQDTFATTGYLTDSGGIRTPYVCMLDNPGSAFAIFKLAPDATALNQMQLLAHVSAAGDLEMATASQGVILKSPNGTRFRVTVDNTGALTTTGV